jgi:SAM-dependent methyltransferase
MSSGPIRTSGYQSFDDEGGSSNSAGKLAALQMPDDLTGKRVLDIGCNEGFFAMAAKDRGAAEVVGIDQDADAIERARARRGDIDFLNQPWDELPAGPFDLVLMLSALHYEANPRPLLQRIWANLSHDGMFILECGISHLRGSTVEWTQRPIPRDDVAWYPTRDLLIERYLRHFAVREVGPSVQQPGDPASRVVFHCHRRRPIVLLIPGRSKIGKTTFTRELQRSATMTLEVDRLVYAMSHAVQRNTPLLELIGEASDSGCDVGQTVRLFEERDLARDFAQLLADQIVPEEPVIQIEGYALTHSVVGHLQELLGGRAQVWLVDRLLDSETRRGFDDAVEAEMVRLQAQLLQLRAAESQP